MSKFWGWFFFLWYKKITRAHGLSPVASSLTKNLSSAFTICVMQSQIVLWFSYPVYNRMLTSSTQTASLLVWRRVIASNFCLQASASCSFFKSCWRYFWASRLASSICFCNVSLSYESRTKTNIVLTGVPLQRELTVFIIFHFKKKCKNCKNFGTEQIRGSLSCDLETKSKKMLCRKTVSTLKPGIAYIIMPRWNTWVWAVLKRLYSGKEWLHILFWRWDVDSIWTITKKYAVFKNWRPR